MALDMNGVELPTKRLPKLEQNMLTILRSMEDLTPSKFPFVGGIYGDMGTGKTVTGMKLLQNIVPQDKKILYINTAAGYSTFNNHPELMKRVKRIQFERQEQLVAIGKAIGAAKKYMASDKAAEANNMIKALSLIDGVMFDEYTHMAKLDQAWIVRTRATQAEENNTFKDPHNPAQPDYLSQQVRSNEVIEAFMNAGVHCVFICHARYDEKTAVYRPDFPAATGADVFRVLHSMYYAESPRNEKNMPVRQLQLQPGRKFVAKNRVGGLGVTATVEQIINAYHKWGINDDAKEAPKELASPQETIVTEDSVPEKETEETPVASTVPEAKEEPLDLDALLK